MPLVGLGTWESLKDEAKAAINWALEAGYRHFDTAFMYKNEEAIGEVFREWMLNGKIKREDLFITTKLPCNAMKAEKVRRFLNLSLKNLQMDYVDLYLIHDPFGVEGKHDYDFYPLDDRGRAILDMNTDLLAIWKAMEAQVDAGYCKAIGLSNFNSEQIARIVESARIKPANLQLEVQAYFQQKPLREVCKKYGITVCAYGPLGSNGRVESSIKQGLPAPDVPKLLEDELVVKIARTHGKSPAQVLLRHMIQQDVIVIPKSVTKKRIEENLNVFNFELTAQEMSQLDQLDSNARSFTSSAPGCEEHPEYPLRIPF